MLSDALVKHGLAVLRYDKRGNRRQRRARRFPKSILDSSIFVSDLQAWITKYAVRMVDSAGYFSPVTAKGPSWQRLAAGPNAG